MGFWNSVQCGTEIELLYDKALFFMMSCGNAVESYNKKAFKACLIYYLDLYCHTGPKIYYYTVGRT